MAVVPLVQVEVVLEPRGSPRQRVLPPGQEAVALVTVVPPIRVLEIELIAHPDVVAVAREPEHVGAPDHPVPGVPVLVADLSRGRVELLVLEPEQHRAEVALVLDQGAEERRGVPLQEVVAAQRDVVPRVLGADLERHGTEGRPVRERARHQVVLHVGVRQPVVVGLEERVRDRRLPGAPAQPRVVEP